ncbi:MAG: hypothetical protein IT449_04760 [Phycisphaerales bacterium]|nr:hypothetical protein [Phycisphaerales bacterium]
MIFGGHVHQAMGCGVGCTRGFSRPAGAVLLAALAGFLSEGTAAAPPGEWPSLRSAKPSVTAPDVEVLSAVVLGVSGNVTTAPLGVLPTQREGWTPVAVGDRLPPSTQIRTSLGSRVELKFGDETYVLIDRLSLACVREFYRRGDVPHIRLDLGYGAIRGATTEGTIRSELTVDSPVATLAKEGTRGWEITVEPHTGAFTIALADEGLVDAIRRLGGGQSVHRLVHPGEYANQDNIARMWLHQAHFDRAFKFYGTSGLSKADVGFVAANSTGFAPLAPGGGTESVFLARRTPSRPTADMISPVRVVVPSTIRRPEGNFGTAQTQSQD